MSGHTLYYSPGACSLAAHIALTTAGLHYDLVRVSTPERETQQPAYLAINPKGRVPALRIPGEDEILTELPAILLYIVRQSDAHDLILPADPLTVARVFEWLNWLSGWVHGQGFGLLWRPERSDPDPAAHRALMASGKRIIVDSFAAIEERLARHGPYAVGMTYSIVDPFLLVLYRWGSLIKLDMRGSYPAWTRQTAELCARHAVQDTIALEGLSIADWKAA